ncbi:MAG TPA: hypothetical protein VF021_07570 [Longimicrobiales bacterium]
MLEIFLSSLPSFATLAIVAPLAFLYTAVVATLVGYLRLIQGVRTAYTRKIFHFSIFTAATIVHLLWHLPGVTVLGVVVTSFVVYAVVRGDGFPLYEALARPTDAPHRTLFVAVPLLTTMLGGIATNIFFPATAYIGYLVCGWGDAVGEPVGSRWGRHTYRVPSLSGVPATRSVEGSGAVFIVGWLAAGIGLYASHATPQHSLLVGLAAGLAGALVESVSNHGLDNFTTQVAAAATAFFLR